MTFLEYTNWSYRAAWTIMVPGVVMGAGFGDCHVLLLKGG